MFPRFPSHPMKSENMLLLNLKQGMKKIVNFEPEIWGVRTPPYVEED